MRLTADFFNNHVCQVARDLLGKRLVFGKYEGIITETEGYRGADDEASHAYRFTKRSAIMFGPSGRSYVYLIYGMYHCLNIVTEEKDSPSAVLIRGLMLPDIYLSGPGKICRHLGITMKENGIDLLSNHDFYVTEGIVPKEIITTPRIGITKAKDKLWRFLMSLE